MGNGWGWLVSRTPSSHPAYGGSGSSTETNQSQDLVNKNILALSLNFNHIYSKYSDHRPTRISKQLQTANVTLHLQTIQNIWNSKHELSPIPGILTTKWSFSMSAAVHTVIYNYTMLIQYCFIIVIILFSVDKSKHTHIVFYMYTYRIEIMERKIWFLLTFQCKQNLLKCTDCGEKWVTVVHWKSFLYLY